MAEPEILNVSAVEAVEHFRRKDFVVGFDWRDVAAETHVHSFTVAKAMEIDVLTDIRDAVDKAIADGTTFAEFQAELEPLLRDRGWWGKDYHIDPKTGEERYVQRGSPRRLRVIYDTNLRMAHARGRWERIERLSDRLPYLRYVSVRDSRTRPEHAAWHGIVLPTDHPFWRTHYPPNGWGCRCTVTQLGEADLERYGYKVSDDPDIQSRPWRNNRTGETIQVPEGIDPGFGHNVGTIDRLPLAGQQLTAKLGTPPMIPPGEVLGADGYIAQGRPLRERIVEAAGGDPDAPSFAPRLRAGIISRLRQQRGAGSVTANVIAASNSQGDLRAAERVRLASNLFPASWVRRANETQARVLSNGKKKGGVYRHESHVMVVSEDPSNAVHEYTHHLQETMPDLQAQFEELHIRRTTTEGVRDKVLKLPKYSVLDIGQKDDYIEPYFGRTYDGVPLEVITRAMQITLHSMQGREMLDMMVRGDPDMLDLVLGVLFHYDP